MLQHRWWPLTCLAVLAAAATAPAKDAVAVAAAIDRHVDARLADAKVKPAPLADDAEFLRRAYLHLAGRIPSVSEVRAFLRDTAPDKRRRLVDDLLSSPRYVTHFSNVWRSWMLPEASASFQARFLVPGFETWLRKQFADNVPYDKMVHELLTAPINQQQAAIVYGAGGGRANPSAFYVAKDIKAENVAAATSRLFLGVRLECAQCHNHPFADWKRDQFWQYAAFFSGLRRQGAGDFAVPGQEKGDSREITIPGTDRVVQAKYLDGSEPKWKFKESSRTTLADWLTAPNNPYFARATVNRVWEFLMGTGLVEPVDEMVGTDSKPSHPELLDELAKEFVANKFDLKFLVRAITASKAYQRSGLRTDPGQDDPQLFARMPLRGMSAEQLWDSVAQATGFRQGGPSNPPGVIVVGGQGNPREQFVNKFADLTGKATEFQTSILQALALMNGRVIESATGLENSETLAAVVDNPFMSTAERIETLYLATLSRLPTEKEASRMVRHVEEAGADGKAANQALADVFWVLLNSGEFLLKQ